MTAFAFKQPVATTAPNPDQSGYVWGAADVRTCVVSSPEGGRVLGNGPWTLNYADSSQAEPSQSIYEQFPLPQMPFGLPDDPKTPIGRCKRGWITYPVPANTRPTTIAYQNADMAAPIEWKV